MPEQEGSEGSRARLRATQLLDVNRPQEALRVLALALSADPSDAAALCLAARAELALQQPERARDCAERALALDPEGEWALRLLAIASQRLGLSSAAVDYARRAVAAAPNSWRTHQNLAVVSAPYYGRRRLAWASAERAVALAPEVPETHLAVAAVAMADGKPKQAEAAVREALRLAPDHAGALNELGRIRLTRRDSRGAVRHFAQAAGADAHLQVPVSNVDVVVIAALTRLYLFAYLSALVLGLVASGVPAETRLVTRLVLAAALVAVCAWQVRTCRPALAGRTRIYLRSMPRRDPVSAALLVVPIVGIVVVFGMCLWPGNFGEMVLFDVGGLFLFLSMGLGVWRHRRVRRGVQRPRG